MIQLNYYEKEKITLVTSSENTKINIWDDDSGKCIKTIEEIQDEISQCLIEYYFNDNVNLVAGCSDSTIKILDLKTFNLFTILR
jgi:WD40 repeat protein